MSFIISIFPPMNMTSNNIHHFLQEIAWINIHNKLSIITFRPTSFHFNKIRHTKWRSWNTGLIYIFINWIYWQGNLMRDFAKLISEIFFWNYLRISCHVKWMRTTKLVRFYLARVLVNIKLSEAISLIFASQKWPETKLSSVLD